MRLMGIDWGEKRVGVAVSDPMGWTAQPVEVVPNDKRLFLRLKELISKFDVTEIIVGLPKTLDNKQGPKAAQVMSFSKALRRETGLKVTEFDERFTTLETERRLIAFDMSRDKRREVIDKLAAASILEDFMKRQKKNEG